MAATDKFEKATLLAFYYVIKYGAPYDPLDEDTYKTIQKKLGKKVELPTRAEIQTNKYREKKGLPPLKKK